MRSVMRSDAIDGSIIDPGSPWIARRSPWIAPRSIIDRLESIFDRLRSIIDPSGSHEDNKTLLATSNSTPHTKSMAHSSWSNIAFDSSYDLPSNLRDTFLRFLCRICICSQFTMVLCIGIKFHVETRGTAFGNA